MKTHIAATAIGFAILAASPLPAAAQQSTKLPETLTWTAYDVGSGGYNQAVAMLASLAVTIVSSASELLRMSERTACGPQSRAPNS